MTLEEKLKAAQNEVTNCKQAIQFHEQAKQKELQKLLRADERVRIYSELKEEQDKSKETSAEHPKEAIDATGKSSQ